MIELGMLEVLNILKDWVGYVVRGKELLGQVMNRRMDGKRPIGR